MAHLRTESSKTGRHGSPWYWNSNWLLLAFVIVVGAWTYHIFTQGRTPSRSATVQPHIAEQKTVPPEDLPAVDPAQKDAYLNRLRDLHQETMLSDEQTW